MNLLNEVASLKQLRSSWQKIKKKRNVTPGIDNITIQQFEAQIEVNLKTISDNLRNKTFKFSKIKQSFIKKKSSGYREIGIFTIRDKIVQKSIQLSLERKRKNPLFPEITNSVSIGFVKPASNVEYTGVKKAVTIVKKNYLDGYKIMTCADIKDFFVVLNRRRLFDILKKRIGEDSIYWLLYQCLNPSVLQDDRYLDQTNIADPSTQQGVAQGSILSPLFSNIYLMNFDLHVQKKAILAMRYADDFAFFSKTQKEAVENLEKIKKVLFRQAYGLTFHNKGKKQPKHYQLEREAFFLGLRFKAVKISEWEITPESKKVSSMMDKIWRKTNRRNSQDFASRILYLNKSLQSWFTSYKDVGCTKRDTDVIFDELKKYYRERVIRLLKAKNIIQHDLSDENLKFLGVL